MELIKCHNISLGYDKVSIVKDFTLSINDGEYICIVGENGSGKTTLVKTILGLRKPLSGKIEYLGGLTKKDIGYLPQTSDIKSDFPASVFEIVLSGFEGKRFRIIHSKDEKQEAIYNMQLVGISDLKNKSYQDLSGGQKQRVLLARALSSTNKILFVDEPTSALDPNGIEDMYNIISHINKKHNITIVMVSHDLDNALKYATKIIEFDKTNFVGTKEEYIKYKGIDRGDNNA